MPTKTTIIRLVAVALLLAAIVACAGSSPMTDTQTVDAYHQALEELPGENSAIERGVAEFRETFSDLTRDDLPERLEALYAEEIYFNDTVHIARRRAALVDYMTRTGQQLEHNSIDVHSVIRDGSDVYLRWEMAFITRAAGKRVESHSIGMTHLRFNERGRIVLHQDFWDSASALYAHLPVVGFFMRRAQSAMQ